jgi:hypothetical protein
MQDDYEATISHMDGQHQALLRNRSSTAVEQAEQLRSLENKARKWAKKFLYKVKAAAAKAESAAGISNLDSSISGALRATESRVARNGRSALDTIDSVPSPQPSGRSRPGTEPVSSHSPLAQPSYRSSVSDRDGGGAAAPMQPARLSMLPARQPNGAAAAAPQARRSSDGRHTQPSHDARTMQPGPRAHALDRVPSGHSAQPADSSPYVHTADLVTPPVSEQTPRLTSTGASTARRASRATGGDSQMSNDARTPASGRRGSALLASVNSHLRRSERKSSPSEMNMLDSATSRELGESRSKRRFAKFNGLFQKKAARA